MSKITITTSYPTGFTLVPDSFIDNFLQGSNGEYIKVYLYVLKTLRCGESVDTSDIADALEKEEGDVVRALKYWGKKGVFDIRVNDEDKSISHICIKTPGTENISSEKKSNSASETTEPEIPEELKEKAFKSTQRLPKTEIPEDVTLLITAAEGYFNRTITMSDRNIILYMYDDLGLSFELIDYLFCRGVETGKTQLRYIEKVALTLHENNITSVNEAKALFQESSDIIHTVMKAFGLQSRNPTTVEQKYIAKWSDTFGFDKALIEEACSRSALNTNSGSFQYADKILTNWHKSGVKSMADVEKLDAQHKAATASRPSQTKNIGKPAGAKPSNFHDFDQRGDNIDELEKKLLGEGGEQ